MNANQLNQLSRRAFLARTAKTCFGVSIAASASSLFGEGAAPPPQAATAKHVIFLYMSGGMSHIDTLDPKPDAPEKYTGPAKAISTAVDGIQLGACLPLLAAQMDNVCLLRSLTTTQGAHAQGNYAMHTSYEPRGSIVHPANGAWVNYLSPESKSTLPNYITVHTGNKHPGAGFFDPSYSPLPIGDANSGIKNAKLNGTSEADFHQQVDLRHKLDAPFDEQFHSGYRDVRAYNEMFDAAIKLMKSEDLEAFDLSQESDATQKLYGSGRFARGCLLARRLVQRGVRFIEVSNGGFDWHADNFNLMDLKMPEVDQGLAALLHDLKTLGLLDETLVVLTTEFGRSPEVNGNAGRGHYPKAFSGLIAGGGVKGGTVYGGTSEFGHEVAHEADKIHPDSLNATIGYAMGVPYDKVIMSPTKRPFKMSGRKGQPLTSIFNHT
ncbi:DUF1501 domain-containing protein [Persicirhabdus sediminis]|uniref:DUF1501 domain-containing protein n=1 Tax=Persicirhabdus sediminis TaxID=454144 RepID=A0A8J7SFR7_9BACT|nr:DUF1501 domain-containing protein [Persicirhabdus sediminis]MBK1789645.1 DUF1501 domain-containing protein [Persicirhabdus sediminis]